MSDDAWREVVAALTDPRLRRALAEVIDAGDPPLTPAERRDALRALREAGLLTRSEQFDEGRLRTLLNAGRPEAEHGVDRFLRADGRIGGYPRDAADRLELLRWVADRLLGSAEVLAEKPLTQRLSAFTNDPNTLRRALVDAGLLARKADGTDYRRA